jgi:hypothetical protein
LILLYLKEKLFKRNSPRQPPDGGWLPPEEGTI